MARIRLGEEDPAVRQWLDLVAQQGNASHETREAYLYSMDAFLNWSRDKGLYRTPTELLEDARKDLQAVEFRIAEFFGHLENELGLARNTCVRHYAALRSFLAAHGLQLRRKFPQSWNANPPRLPTREEIRKFLNHADLRLRAQVLCQRDSGLSNQEHLSLKYGDVRKDLEAGREVIVLTLIRHKEKIWFNTFFGPESVEVLKSYIDERRRGTKYIPPERLADDSPLWAVSDADRRAQDVKTYKHNFWVTCKRAGVDLNPHQLRKFFNTTMKLAGVNDSLVEYWMGHKLPQSKAAYLVPPIEKQVQAYLGAYANLTLFMPGSEDVELRTLKVLVESGQLELNKPEVREYLAGKLGIGNTDLKVSNPEKSSEQALCELIFSKLGVDVKPKTQTNGAQAVQFHHKLVRESDLVDLINDGWEIVKELASSKILVRKRA